MEFKGQQMTFNNIIQMSKRLVAPRVGEKKIPFKKYFQHYVKAKL